MKKSKKIPNYYVIINENQDVFIRKFLSKVENLTGVAQNTISKHFSKNTKPYSNGKFTIMKTTNADFKSFNKGNIDNFSNSI